MAFLIDKYVPLITISNDKSNPWFNKSLRSLRNKKKRLYASAKRLSSSTSWSMYKDCLKSYCLAISEAKKKYFPVTCLHFYTLTLKSFGVPFRLTVAVTLFHYITPIMFLSLHLSVLQPSVRFFACFY